MRPWGLDVFRQRGFSRCGCAEISWYRSYIVAFRYGSCLLAVWCVICLVTCTALFSLFALDVLILTCFSGSSHWNIYASWHLLYHENFLVECSYVLLIGSMRPRASIRR